jgi:hypothetical protein
VHITEHAYDRGRERLSFTKNALDKLASKAWESGMRRSQAGGRLRKHLKEIKGNIRIYGDNLYIFTTYRRQPSLVTVYQLPQEYRKYVRAA